MPGIHDLGPDMTSAHEAQLHDLTAVIAADASRMRVLELVRDLGLPDCWIGAGFVRSAVWDHLHGRTPRFPDGDVDVIWFDTTRADAAIDDALEVKLRCLDPAVDWSVTNQARMHARNGDAPYASTQDAVRYWPETATAIAVRIANGRIEIMAPYGLDDLVSMIVRPTPGFVGAKLGIVRKRVLDKRWRERWPRLAFAGDPEVVDARAKPGHDG